MLYFTKIINGKNYIFNAGKSTNNKTEITNTLPIENINGIEEDILFPLASFSEIKRNNNNAQNTTDYIIIDKAEGLIDNGSVGDGDGYHELLKSTGEWKLKFNSGNLQDGVYDIYCVVVDFAGNARYYKDSMLVQNHAPIITSVVLSTDIDGDGDCDVTTDGTGDEDNLYNSFDKNTGIANTDFVVRNNLLKMRLNVVGGKIPLKYFMSYNGESLEGSPDGDNSGIFTIKSFPVDGAESYTIWVEDSVETNLSLSSERRTISLELDNTDDVVPVAQLFELNTELTDTSSRGSLFKDSNGKVQGHIEPREYSPFDNDDKEDPDISGKVTLRGEAYDNQRITSIKLELPTGNVDIAEWSEGSLKVINSNAKLVKNELGLSGHYVEWSYVWDTNAIVGKDKTVSVVVKDVKSYNETVGYDRTNNIPRKESNKLNSTDWGYNSMTVDIVPYITEVCRNEEYSNNRARSGAIPLLRDEWTNRIKGFNLGTSSDTISVKITETNKGDGYSFDCPFDKSSTDNSITFAVPSTAKDGYISTIVNGISSINNINDNELDYNKESNEYQSETKYWTDDRFVRIWQDTDRFGNDDRGATGVVLAQNPAYPAMAMDEGGKLYASYTNYSMHNVYYTTIGGSSTAVYNGFDAPEETTIFVTGKNSNATVNVAYMANYQSGGDYKNWTHYWGDAGGLYLYDPNLKKMNDNESNDAETFDYNVSGFRDNYFVTRFELLYHDKQFQQFKNFRLARGSNAIGKNVHIAYYDIDTMSIHYSNISVKKSNTYATNVGRDSFEATWVNIDGTYDEHDTEQIDGVAYNRGNGNSLTKMSDGSKNIILGEEQFADGLTRSTATGEYVGIDVTSKHYPVIAYFDSVNQVIKLARANAENPKINKDYPENGAHNWEVQRVITNPSDDNYTTTNGNYVDVQIDSDGKAHVVFVNGKGELIYVKSKNSSDDGKTAYTFGPSVVIAENSPMNVDLTVRGETPYIGYLSSLGSFDGLNTAFYDKSLDLDNDGIKEGGWETMSAPLIHAVSNNRASVEAHPTPASSTWESAHAYYSAGYYRVAYYIGNGSGH